MHARSFLLSSFLLSLLLIGFCAYVTVQPKDVRSRDTSRDRAQGIAFVSFVDGQVEVQSRGGAWRPAYRGYPLRHGDRVRTGVDGRVELSLKNTPGRLRLERETVFTLQEGREGDRWIVSGGQVTAGSVWAEVAGRTAGRRFVLGTPVGEASAERTVFRVHVLRPDSVRVSVYEGSAEVSSVGGAEDVVREVPVGQALMLVPGRTPAWEKIDLRGDWSDGWQERKAGRQFRTGEREVIRARVKRALIRDLQDINPDVYLSVEVELKGFQGHREPFRPEEARIRKIQVRSRVWDGLEAGKKVELLNETFSILQERYPNLTHSVLLKFDDGRPDLPLKYAMSLKG